MPHAEKLLQTFPNPAPRRDYVIQHVAPEFTSLCPVTGQPDFGTVTIEYVADQRCVELKSLKLYLQAFRQQGIFYEAVTNLILDDLVTTLAPRRLRVETRWSTRGGMHSTIVAEYQSPSARRGGAPPARRSPRRERRAI
jgi:7-cyano-7-deazaguanine reductase